jgi:hypothetical protein
MAVASPGRLAAGMSTVPNLMVGAANGVMFAYRRFGEPTTPTLRASAPDTRLREPRRVGLSPRQSD